MNIFWKILNDENNDENNGETDQFTLETNEKIITKLSQIKKNIQNDVKNIQKYKNYHVFPNIIHTDVCNFIIAESEKYAEKNGWTNNRHANYPTTDIPVKNIPNICLLIDNIIKYDVLVLFQKYYNINKYFLEYNDIFIVKYDSNAQNKLEKHRDGSLFSFNILLNSPTEFIGGGTIFEVNGNNILVNNTQGGVVIHSGQLLHSGNEITNGKRYLLVGFIKYLANF